MYGLDAKRRQSACDNVFALRILEQIDRRDHLPPKIAEGWGGSSPLLFPIQQLEVAFRHSIDVHG